MMQEELSREFLFEQLFRLYSDMEEAYDTVAEKIGLSCDGCRDNCCDSYFHHHTHIEWAYLWEGMRSCSDEARQAFISKSKAYLEQTQRRSAQGEKPNVMCPLNDKGLCRLYKHRLMICRMHGVPNRLVRPDGKAFSFPGCIRSQQLCTNLEEVPVLDRTDLYRRLASLEMAFLGPKIKALARVNLTLAEMIVNGPPEL
jgi:hypothetical protein